MRAIYLVINAVGELVMLKKEKQRKIINYKNKINELNNELHKPTLSPHQCRHKFLESISYKNKLKALIIK